MSRNVTLRDVAERAGVHVSTVSRALNGLGLQGRIPAETITRIRRAAEEVGYLPNSVGRALRTGRSGVVAMVVPDIANLYSADINHAAEEVLTGHGYSMLLASTGDRLDVADLQVAAMVSAQPEGFLYGAARLGDPVVARVREAGVPIVLYNRTDGSDDLSTVLPADRDGTEMAVTHLLGLGHRVIGHVAGPQDISSGAVRRRVFHAAVERAGGTAFSLEAAGHTEEEGERVGSILLDAHPSITAVVAANDRVALGVVDAIRERGRRCPEDISVVGFNDMPYTDRFVPALTTMRVPQQEIGRQAAEALVAVIEDPARPPTHVTVPAQLMVRGSTMHPPRRRQPGPRSA